LSERIIIEFDDSDGKEPEKKKEEKLIIELDEKNEQDEDIFAELTEKAEVKEETYQERLLKQKINSSYRGNQGISNFFESSIKFPEGIENSFRKKFSLELKDRFYNSVTENNRFIILSSGKGNVYLIDKISGYITGKMFFENESFEKTGLVYNNRIFINSLAGITEISENGLTKKKIYGVPNGYFIWSNLNRAADNLVFLEYNPVIAKASFKIIDLVTNDIVKEFSFNVKKFLSDKICIADNKAFVLSDNELLVYDFDRMREEMHALDKYSDLKTDENSFIFYNNYKLFITSHLNEIYYLDLPNINYNFKFSGIRNSYINSAGGFDDNIFFGTLDGWKYYRSGGLQVYSFEDENENRIECLSRNIIVLSQKNKIIFCNLNRFQEAEGYVISASEAGEAAEIISAFISEKEIFVLTKNGILEAYTNDKLNIHI
jgi:hypothetical protein